MGLLSQLGKSYPATANTALLRHTEIFESYHSWLDAQPELDAVDRSVTIIARSPASPVTRALVANADALKLRDVSVRAIISQAEPTAAMRELAAALGTLSPASQIGEIARWANRACLLDAHEQLILGRAMCWSGDMMRRAPGKRDGLDLFEENAPQTVRLGNLAFHAIWEICDPLPRASIRGVLSTRATAADRPDHGALAARSAARRLERLTDTRH